MEMFIGPENPVFWRPLYTCVAVRHLFFPIKYDAANDRNLKRRMMYGALKTSFKGPIGTFAESPPLRESCRMKGCT